MKTFQYTIHDECGIHARPAGLLAKLAGQFKSVLTVQKGDQKAEATHLFSLMGLCIKQGDCVTVTAQGEDEGKAIQALKEFFGRSL